MIPPRWAVAAPPDLELTRALAADLHIPEPLAAILVQRGLAAPERAKEFLRPDLERLSDPLAWADMPRAVSLIADAVRRRTPILVHGDYDVDGQCAAALLTRVLQSVGGQVHAFVPHRIRDGYDFGPAGLAQAQRLGATLIITCDCGITADAAVGAARAAGIDVIVTDHHRPRAALPPASAVLDPQRPDCASLEKDLCGTGVAFKLAQALVPALGVSPNLPFHFLDLVALATVADVVPLTGENRILVRHGLKMLADSRWTGVRALVEAAGLAGKPVKSGHVGFILGPRLNAAGRIGDANLGLKLLLSDDPVEAASASCSPRTTRSCSPPTGGIPGSSGSWRRGWWSATGVPPSSSAGTREPTRGGDRAAALWDSTCTQPLNGWGATSRSTAATRWRRGSRCAGSATRTSVLRFSRWRASFCAPTTSCPHSASTWSCRWASSPTSWRS
jgi:hypothetical protein